jgi:mRNA interferase RelE/StbE
MYKVKVLSQAQKDLDKISSKIFNKIKATILNLAKNPRPQGSIKLTQQDGYRFRISDYRLLYRIDDCSREIYVYRIKHRREVYR